jgi:hypothetical protein
MCLTRYKEGHPEVKQKEQDEKAALQLSTPKIKDWDHYQKYYEGQPTNEGNETAPQTPATYLDNQCSALRRYLTQANPRELPRHIKPKVSIVNICG